MLRTTSPRPLCGLLLLCSSTVLAAIGCSGTSGGGSGGGTGGSTTSSTTTSSTSASGGVTCFDDNAPCMGNVDCCSTQCGDGFCKAVSSCSYTGTPCNETSQCCAHMGCTADGRCAPFPCTPAGQGCTYSKDCCSGSCSASSTCD